LGNLNNKEEGTMDKKNNTGSNNSGNGNSGDWNSGYWNSGDGNSGYGNSGYWNSGNKNSGWKNSGYGNSGDGNSGYGNSGNKNSGYGNSCDRSSGIFCTKTPQLFIFNKPSDKTWEEIDHPTFSEFYLNKWIAESEMTDEEKTEQKDFHIREGYLKTYTWEEAWANYWRDSGEEDKQKVLNLPNFDAKIFKEITGIDVEKKEPSCDGKVVEIDGKKYKLTEVK
jgi:hypothetical protein